MIRFELIKKQFRGSKIEHLLLREAHEFCSELHDSTRFQPLLWRLQAALEQAPVRNYSKPMDHFNIELYYQFSPGEKLVVEHLNNEGKMDRIVFEVVIKK